ncbi:hypothetical protein PAEH1_04015 [Paenalcaligenes hominis]|uniref:Cytochrome c-type biogenesis protein n=1 Tax=Paenalcaligenes hominis TaxID=643674 RepID=A0A1U9JYT4_9BURK|nr:cytochrome c-type biogenesis protein [Paenalcaligenes hominis]AQS50942.1 hypothetical protein PAEH1_04015 [Paenalcaligenes hominis]
MNLTRQWLWLIVFVLGVAVWIPAGAVSLPSSDVSLEQRYYQLSKELRCLVCQNESLAESPAGLADDLRQELRHQLRTGKTDAQIKNYLVERYGYFVLYRPPFVAQTWWLWLMPGALFLALGSWLIVQLRRAKKNGSVMASNVSAKAYSEKLKKIQDEFEKGSK